MKSLIDEEVQKSIRYLARDGSVMFIEKGKDPVAVKQTEVVPSQKEKKTVEKTNLTPRQRLENYKKKIS